LSGVAAFVASLNGLSAGVLAFAVGALGALGHAPFHIWPLTLIAFTVFVWQLDGAAGKKAKRAAAFWRGWCLGFGYFLSGVWWVGSAFLVEPEQYAALIPFAITAMPAGLALFWAAAAWVAIGFWRRDWRRVALLASVLFFFEYLRGHVLTGFPWNMAGYVWPAGGPVSQSAAVIGAYGLTLLTLFAFMAPAALAGPERRRGARMTPAVISLFLFAGMFGLGFARLTLAPEGEDTGVRLRVVQAGIDQREKWRPENRAMVRDRYLALSASEGLSSRTHVVWAESALPMYLLEEPRVLDAIARTIGDDRVLLSGVVRRDFADPLQPRYYNSFAAISIDRGIPVVAGVYDKVKLVPFGEFPPFASLLRRIGLDALIDFSDGYTSGASRDTVEAPGAPPLSPQICYEVIFPRFALRGPDRPGWIVNVTNDAWYEGTPGPHQLYNQARYRSIEDGLPLARAASGGVSAIVDAYGRTQAALDATEEGVVDGDLPAALGPTPYAFIGDAPVFALLGLGLIIGLTSRRRTAARR
jgi:apolipoprotein N-acyltransferase